MLLAILCFHFILMQHDGSRALGNNESCKSLAELYTDIRVKSSCWLFNVVGDSGTGSNLAQNPMKVFLPYEIGKDSWQWLLVDNKSGHVHTRLQEQSEPRGSTVTGMRENCWLFDFVPFVLKSLYNSGLSCSKSCVSCGFRYIFLFIVLLNIVTHPAESQSAWFTSAIIRVPQKWSQLTHFSIVRKHRPQNESSQSFGSWGDNWRTARNDDNSTQVIEHFTSESRKRTRRKVCVNAV